MGVLYRDGEVHRFNLLTSESEVLPTSVVVGIPEPSEIHHLDKDLDEFIRLQRLQNRYLLVINSHDPEIKGAKLEETDRGLVYMCPRVYCEPDECTSGIDDLANWL